MNFYQRFFVVLFVILFLNVKKLEGVGFLLQSCAYQGLLSQDYTNSANSPAKCFTKCGGTTKAIGLLNNLCYCGSSVNSLQSYGIGSSASCDINCAGAATSLCGGQQNCVLNLCINYISVYLVVDDSSTTTTGIATSTSTIMSTTTTTTGVDLTTTITLLPTSTTTLLPTSTTTLLPTSTTTLLSTSTTTLLPTSTTTLFSTSTTTLLPTSTTTLLPTSTTTLLPTSTTTLLPTSTTTLLPTTTVVSTTEPFTSPTTGDPTTSTTILSFKTISVTGTTGLLTTASTSTILPTTVTTSTTLPLTTVTTAPLKPSSMATILLDTTNTSIPSTSSTLTTLPTTTTTKLAATTTTTATTLSLPTTATTIALSDTTTTTDKSTSTSTMTMSTTTRTIPVTTITTVALPTTASWTVMPSSSTTTGDTTSNLPTTSTFSNFLTTTSSNSAIPITTSSTTPSPSTTSSTIFVTTTSTKTTTDLSTSANTTFGLPSITNKTVLSTIWSTPFLTTVTPTTISLTSAASSTTTATSTTTTFPTTSSSPSATTLSSTITTTMLSPTNTTTTLSPTNTVTTLSPASTTPTLSTASTSTTLPPTGSTTTLPPTNPVTTLSPINTSSLTTTTTKTLPSTSTTTMSHPIISTSVFPTSATLPLSTNSTPTFRTTTSIPMLLWPTNAGIDSSAAIPSTVTSTSTTTYDPTSFESTNIGITVESKTSVGTINTSSSKAVITTADVTSSNSIATSSSTLVNTVLSSTFPVTTSSVADSHVTSATQQIHLPDMNESMSSSILQTLVFPANLLSSATNSTAIPFTSISDFTTTVHPPALDSTSTYQSGIPVLLPSTTVLSSSFAPFNFATLSSDSSAIITPVTTSSTISLEPGSLSSKASTLFVQPTTYVSLGSATIMFEKSSGYPTTSSNPTDPISTLPINISPSLGAPTTTARPLSTVATATIAMPFYSSSKNSILFNDSNNMIASKNLQSTGISWISDATTTQRQSNIISKPVAEGTTINVDSNVAKSTLKSIGTTSKISAVEPIKTEDPVQWTHRSTSAGIADSSTDFINKDLAGGTEIDVSTKAFDKITTEYDTTRIVTTTTVFIDPISKCSYTEWSNYTECSSTCGNSVRKKYRLSLTVGLCRSLEGVENCTTVKACDPLSDNTLAIIAKVMQALGCAYVLGIVGATLVFSSIFRLNTYERFLQANEEIALLLAHIVIVTIVDKSDQYYICQISTVLLQYFFLVLFIFLLLESIQCYLVMTNIIFVDGLLPKSSTMIAGWGCPAIYAFCTGIFNRTYMISQFSCWTNFDTDWMFSILPPCIAFSVLSFIITEAAGMEYEPPLIMSNSVKRFTNHSSQKGLVFKIPLHLSTWLAGSVTVYYRYFPMYVVVLGLNISLGVIIILFHTLANDKVRNLFKRTHQKVVRRVIRKEGPLRKIHHAPVVHVKRTPHFAGLHVIFQDKY